MFELMNCRKELYNVICRCDAGDNGEDKNECCTLIRNPSSSWEHSMQAFTIAHRLVGLVVKVSASGAEDPGFESRLQWDFSGSSHTSDLKIGTPVATLPGAWRYRVGTRTGWPGVSILWLGEVESLIYNFYLSVAARKIVCADPSLRYTSLLQGR